MKHLFLALAFVLMTTGVFAQSGTIPVISNSAIPSTVWSSAISVADTTSANKFTMLLTGGTNPIYSFRLLAMVSRGNVYGDTIVIDTVYAISDTLFDVTNPLTNYTLRKAWLPSGTIVDSTGVYYLLGRPDYTVMFGLKPFDGNTMDGGKAFLFHYTQ